ncbi:MAG: response regulator transcription factor [Bacteroidales bacterium]|nr:response regulator transcription factor [Bacteroidales bacterium]
MAIKILLADDHQLVREGLATLLGDDPNIEIVGQAKDGKEAIENAKKLKPDILIMDIGMPVFNGIEATEILKKEIPEMKVIGLTLHAERNFVKGMLEAGAYGYLFKTCAYEELILAINTVNSGNKYFSNEITEILVNEYIGKKKEVEEIDTPLSDREQEVLKLLAEGKSNNEIAKLLFVSAKTIGTHKQHIYEKLGLESAVDLVKYAIKKGIISL